MPCASDCGPSDSQRIHELRDKLDNLTRMLCAQCQLLEKKVVTHSIGDDDLMTDETRAWWEAHKAADAKREQREKRRAAADRQHKLNLFNQLKEELGL